MLEGTAPRERIIAASLRLAETRGWRDLSLGEIAAESGVPLAEFRNAFKSKGQILAAFTRAVDGAVLEKFAAPTGDAPRDRLFDVIITRLEIMQPYKAALRRIAKDLRGDFGALLGQLAPALKSQYWMLAAAGIDGEGRRGLLRVNGLLSIYASVLQVWLDDDDPGMARTMAALDAKLRRAETAVHRMERIRDGLRACARVMKRERREEAPAPTPAEEPGAGPAPAAPQQA